MIDALLYAARDGIRSAGFNYGKAECEIMADGMPPARAGNWFIAVHGGKSRPGPANKRNLYELFDFSVTLTGRIEIAMDRVGDQMIARNLALVSLGQRQGFNAKIEQLRTFLHMNWGMVVLTGQSPASANDNIASWATGTVYGFVKPGECQGEALPELVGGEWLGSNPDEMKFALKSELRVIGAERFQPQTAATGIFV